MKARISARARDDLATIYSYLLHERGGEAADSFLIAAQAAAEFLIQNPEAGPHPTWVRRHQTLRFWVVTRTNYIIYYFADYSGVSIERVLDGRRDVKRIIEERKEDPS